VPPAAHSRPSPADYERAIGLRGAWEGLTEDVADPAVWDADRLFHYRKAVRGGHRFVAYDMERQVREPAFDHDRLAAALSDETGTRYTGITLPFDDFAY